MVSIQIWTDVLSVLIWVQTVCKCNQQTTKVAASKIGAEAHPYLAKAVKEAAKWW